MKKKRDPDLTPERQLELWLSGDSRCPNTHDECCPDFSCCKPELLASKAERAAFVAASQEDRNRMLGKFLAGLVATIDEPVYIAGQEES